MLGEMGPNDLVLDFDEDLELEFSQGKTRVISP